MQREITQKSRRRGDGGAGIKVMLFENGGKSHKPRNLGRNKQLKKTRKWILLAKSLNSSLEGTRTGSTLTSVQAS